MRKYWTLSLLSLTLIATPVSATSEDKTATSQEATESSVMITESNESEEASTSSELTSSQEIKTTENSSIPPEQILEEVPQESPEKVVDSLVTSTGIPSSENKQLVPKTAPSDFREQLLSSDFGITKETLDTYSDEQLENAYQLFHRYNYDIYGLDYGAFPHVLFALYRDNIISWESVSKNLSFVPKDLSYQELIQQVDSLQAYLHSLYPSNSPMFASNRLTNEQLIAILTSLDETNKATPMSWPGKIALIIRKREQLNAQEETTNSSTTKSETNSSTDKKKEVTSSKKETAKKEEKDNLPQTNEKKNTWLSVVGIILVVAIAGAWIIKKKK